MTRMLAFVAALLLTAITVSSACIASGTMPLQFTIEPAAGAGLVKVQFRTERDGRSDNNWSDSFAPRDLSGLDPAALNGAVTRPIRFAVARDAGRVDCSGTGSNGMARGSCSVTADRGFNAFLVQRGVAQPTDGQTFSMIALNVRRELVGALAEAHYPVPTINNLVELTAVGANPAYIAALSGEGYRPQSLQALVEFAALKITPEYIGSFARAGYSNIPPDDLIQLKALDITPQYIAGFERIGYRDLPVSTLVQLKALDITPSYVLAVRQGDALPSPDHLVELKAVTEDLRRH